MTTPAIGSHADVRPHQYRFAREQSSGDHAMTTLYFYRMRFWSAVKAWAERRHDSAVKKYNEGWRM